MPVGTKPGAKMTLTREPALPSKCLNCSFSADGKKQFLDCNVSEDYYGAIVFCLDCVREFAQAVGYVTEDETVAALERAEAETIRSVAAFEKLKAIEDVLRTYGLNGTVDLYNSAIPIDPVPDPEAGLGEDLSEGTGDGPVEPSSKF